MMIINEFVDSLLILSITKTSLSNYFIKFHPLDRNDNWTPQGKHYQETDSLNVYVLGFRYK